MPASLHHQLSTRLLAYDDEALAALSNKGLVRRAKKDLEKNVPTLAGETADALTLVVEDQQVQVVASVKDCRCSCPAGGICRHILAALLFLRSRSSSQMVPGAAPPPQEAAPAPPAGNHAVEIIALEEAAIVAWAGKALYRKAMKEVVAGLDLRVEAGEGKAAVLRLPAWSRTIRWLPGGGLGSVICDCHAKGPCLHALVAILLVRQAGGVLSPGDEAAGALEAASGAPRTREEVLASVAEVMEDAVAIGLSRLSAATSQRLRTLAVSAHGVDLPRLERSLRGVAGEIDLTLARDAQAASGSLLFAAARAAALATALALPVAGLVGQHRRQYDAVGALDLIGAGAYRWTTRSGYAGLTVYFWDPGAETWASWTEARLSGAGVFDPGKRYREEGPWTGCENPAAASRSQIRLSGAFRSRQGRLSGRSATRAIMTGPSELEEIRAVVRNWSVLIEPARKLFGGGLQSGGELEGLRLLQPATWGTPRFDRLRQELQWPIQDDRGATICLWLPFTATTEAAIPWLEKRAHATGTRVLGVVRLREARLLVEPVALHEDGHVVNLTLDMVSATSGPAGSTSQPDDREEDGIDTIDAEQLRSASNIGLLLASGLAELEGIAEAGLCASRDLARLRAVAQRTEALGLASCASSCRRFLDRMETIRRDMDAPRRDAARALVQAYHVFSLASAQEAVSSATAALTGSP